MDNPEGISEVGLWLISLVGAGGVGLFFKKLYDTLIRIATLHQNEEHLADRVADRERLDELSKANDRQARESAIAFGRSQEYGNKLHADLREANERTAEAERKWRDCEDRASSR